MDFAYELLLHNLMKNLWTIIVWYVKTSTKIYNFGLLLQTVYFELVTAVQLKYHKMYYISSTPTSIKYQESWNWMTKAMTHFVSGVF